MKFSIVSLALLVSMITNCRTVKTPSSDEKIYGGTKITDNSWPMVVLIQMQEGKCSGTLVNPRLIVTAAHCIIEGKPTLANIHVYFGNNEIFGKEVAVEKFNYMPDYKESDVDYDIAYIRLKAPLNIPTVPILTDAQEAEAILTKDVSVTLVGFGRTTSGGKSGEKHVVESAYKMPNTTVSLFDWDTSFYVGKPGAGACSGDSGGPAFAKAADGSWRVFGVTSHANCEKGSSIYANMAAGLCWIEKDSGIKFERHKLPCDEPRPSFNDRKAKLDATKMMTNYVAGECYCGTGNGKCGIFRLGESKFLGSFEMDPGDVCHAIDCLDFFKDAITKECNGSWHYWPPSKPFPKELPTAPY